MRIASRPFARAGRSARGYFLMMLGVLVLGGVGTTGCEDKHIGRPCELGTTGSTDASGGPIGIISSPVLACPSRICLLPGDMLTATAMGDGPTCTASCSTDDDCSDAETASNKLDKSDPHCKGHFYCGYPTTSGPFACQKFCICNDFVGEPPGGAKPPVVCP